MTQALPKVILVTSSNLGPYHQARYSYLAEGEIDLLVVKTPVREFHRPWQTTPEGFRTCTPFVSESGWPALFRAAYNLLRAEKPQVVVCVGYNRRYVWALSLCCRLLRIPCVLYLVGWEGERQRKGWKELIKKIYCRFAFTAALATGERAGRYAETLGIRRENIQLIGNVVDNKHFSYQNSRDGASRFLNLPESFFLTVARLSPEKNISTLLESFYSYRQGGGSWHLCISGIGPQEEDLKSQMRPEFAPFIHWLGWVGYDELPELYQRAKCLVLPSYIEPWGLVANEAMAAGLPILISTQCGCQPELCHENVNGFSFAPEDRVFLTELLKRVEDAPEAQRSGWGKASRQIIEGYTLESWRRVFCAGVLSSAKSLASHTVLGVVNNDS